MTTASSGAREKVIQQIFRRLVVDIVRLFIIDDKNVNRDRNEKPKKKKEKIEIVKRIDLNGTNKGGDSNR